MDTKIGFLVVKNPVVRAIARGRLLTLPRLPLIHDIPVSLFPLILNQIALSTIVEWRFLCTCHFSIALTYQNRRCYCQYPCVQLISTATHFPTLIVPNLNDSGLKLPLHKHLVVHKAKCRQLLTFCPPCNLHVLSQAPRDASPRTGSAVLEEPSWIR